jgi:hypothetical protein
MQVDRADGRRCTGDIKNLLPLVIAPKKSLHASLGQSTCVSLGWLPFRIIGTDGIKAPGGHRSAAGPADRVDIAVGPFLEGDRLETAHPPLAHVLGAPFAER